MGDVVLLSALCAELAREHDKIMRHVDGLERAEDDEAVASVRTLEGLASLQRVLILHFGHEQMADGLYDVLALWDSDYRGELDGLVEEHRIILETVDTLLDSGEGMDSAELEAAVADLCALIRQHEQREYALVTPLVGEH